MSSAAKSILAGAEPICLDPNEIDVDLGGRIGFYHEDKAVAFGRLLHADGQRDYVKVSRSTKGPLPWRLHVGLHRTMGARLEGLPIYAIPVSGTPDQLRDLEASENLHRRPLPPVERAKFVFELCRAAQERLARKHGELKQQELAVRARWDRVKSGESTAENALQEESDDTADKMSAVYGWQQSAAEALELDPRTIRRALHLYRLLIEPFPDLIEALAKHPVIGENASQLKLIAGVKDEAQRRQVIELVLEQPSVSVEGARIRLGIDSGKAPAPTPDVKFTNTISDSWGRLSTTAKREYLPRFVTMLTPDMKARLRELLDVPDPQFPPDTIAYRMSQEGKL